MATYKVHIIATRRGHDEPTHHLDQVTASNAAAAYRAVFENDMIDERWDTFTVTIDKARTA